MNAPLPTQLFSSTIAKPHCIQDMVRNEQIYGVN